MGFWKKRNVLKHTLLVLGLLTLSFFLNEMIYGPQDFPMHGDEYTHIAQARDIVEHGEIRFVHPYFEKEHLSSRTQNGFHIFLALILFVIAEDHISSFIILRNVIFTLNVFLMFSLGYRLSGKFRVGLFSGLFFTFMQTTGDFLGNALLMPLNVGITFLLSYMLVYLKYRTKKSKRLAWLMSLLFLLSLTFHPPTAVFIFLITIIETRISVDKKEISERNWLSIIIFMMGTLIASFVLFLNKVSGQSIREIARKYVIFDISWTPFVPLRITPFEYFGIIASLIAAYGLIILVRKRLKTERIFLVSLSLASVNVLTFYTLEHSLFIPGRRMIFYLVLMMCILAGYGLEYARYTINRLLTKRHVDIEIKKVLVSSFIVIIFVIQLFSLYLSPLYEPRTIIDQGRYEMLQYVTENYGEGNVIMIDPLTAISVYPLSGNYIVGKYISNLNTGNLGEVEGFGMTEDCGNKQFIIEENRVDFLISRRNEDCSFFEPIIRDGEYTLYYVTKSHYNLMP